MIYYSFPPFIYWGTSSAARYRSHQETQNLPHGGRYSSQKKLSGTQAASCRQCYLCIEALCHSSMDPSHWCTRWQGGLVLESVRGHTWTEPQLRRHTTGQWLWSFRSGGTAHSSGRAQMLQEEMEKQQADRFKLIPKIYPCKVTKCSCEMLRCV